jgi:hypothetical protein
VQAAAATAVEAIMAMGVMLSGVRNELVYDMRLGDDIFDMTELKFYDVRGCRHSLLEGILRTTDVMMGGKRALVSDFEAACSLGIFLKTRSSTPSTARSTRWTTTPSSRIYYSYYLAFIGLCGSSLLGVAGRPGRLAAAKRP